MFCQIIMQKCKDKYWKSIYTQDVHVNSTDTTVYFLTNQYWDEFTLWKDRNMRASVGVTGFIRNIRIQFLYRCKGKYHLLVCVKQIYKFGDHFEIILITLKATENSPLGRNFFVLIILNSKEPALGNHFNAAIDKSIRVL
jgi:hypothetical protein